MAAPKPGQVFTHRSRMEPGVKGIPMRDIPKARCEVTAVRQGKVYYRYAGTEGKPVSYMTLSDWNTKYAGRKDAR